MNNKIILYILAFFFFNLSIAQKSLPNVSLIDFNNNEVSIKSLTENHLVIMSFWATWCLPCVKELNAINEVYEDWQEETNVQLIAVSLDDNRTISRVRPMVNANGWDYTILFDKNQDLKRALQITNIPYLIILQNGKIMFQHAGYAQGNEDLLYEKIKELASKN